MILRGTWFELLSIRLPPLYNRLSLHNALGYLYVLGIVWAILEWINKGYNDNQNRIRISDSPVRWSCINASYTCPPLSIVNRLRIKSSNELALTLLSVTGGLPSAAFFFGVEELKLNLSALHWHNPWPCKMIKGKKKKVPSVRVDGHDVMHPLKLTYGSQGAELTTASTRMNLTCIYSIKLPNYFMRRTRLSHTTEDIKHCMLLCHGRRPVLQTKYRFWFTKCGNPPAMSVCYTLSDHCLSGWRWNWEPSASSFLGDRRTPAVIQIRWRMVRVMKIKRPVDVDHFGKHRPDKYTGVGMHHALVKRNSTTTTTLLSSYTYPQCLLEFGRGAPLWMLIRGYLFHCQWSGKYLYMTYN